MPTPASDNSPAWFDMRLPRFTPTDNMHEEFHTFTLELMACLGASAVDATERFEQCAISHFEQRDEWMRPTNFPPRDCHLAEHAAVLKSVDDAKQAVVLGEAGADVV